MQLFRDLKSLLSGMSVPGLVMIVAIILFTVFAGMGFARKAFAHHEETHYYLEPGQWTTAPLVMGVCENLASAISIVTTDRDLGAEAASQAWGALFESPGSLGGRTCNVIKAFVRLEGAEYLTEVRGEYSGVLKVYLAAPEFEGIHPEALYAPVRGLSGAALDNLKGA